MQAKTNNGSALGGNTLITPKKMHGSGCKILPWTGN